MRRSDAGGARRAALVALAALVAVGSVAAPVAEAQPTAGDTTFVVALAEDGSAEVILRLTFDLDREEERRALERLRENRTAVAAGFADGLRAVAARTAEETGREMRVTEPDVRIATEGATGVVELSVTWVGLAAVEGDRLVLRRPFAEGFRPPGRFEVRAPEGYVLASATPAATRTSEDSAAWAAGTSLEGFRAAFVPADASTSRSLPGFGAPAAIVAVALAALAARRRS